MKHKTMSLKDDPLIKDILKRLDKLETSKRLFYDDLEDGEEIWKQKYELLKESHDKLIKAYNHISRNIPQ